MVRLFLFVIVGIGVLGGVWFFDRESGKPATTSEIPTGEVLSTAIISGVELRLEIVRTSEEQVRGLSGRELLAENSGMLFVYENPVMPGFWMKEMNFAIDIIWIDENKKIVGMNENIAPETFPEIFYPPSPVQYVLEINANWTKTHNISIGDEITFHGIF
ncbi:MAG: DUF192 domain-containing protein [Patescibacteria group bacterium]